MNRYTFSIEIHSGTHPVQNDKLRNKVLCVLQDIIDQMSNPNSCSIDDQGYILGEDDRRLPYVRIFDKENKNQVPF